VWPGWATQAVPGERRVWRPPSLWGGWHARPADGVIQGKRGATPLEATGPPAGVQGGGVAGVGRTGRAVGAPGMAPPLWGGCHARPAGGVIQGGARSDAAGGDEAPLPVYWGP